MVRTLVLYATMLLVPPTPLTACAAQVPLSDGAKLQLGNHSCFLLLWPIPCSPTQYRLIYSSTMRTNGSHSGALRHHAASSANAINGMCGTSSFVGRSKASTW